MIIKDSILVKYCKKGFKKFCNQIYKRYFRLVASIVYGIVRDPNIVEDIVQDTFMKFFAKIKDYREQTNLKNWLSKIARNRSIEMIRSAAYRYKDNFKPIDEIVEGNTANGKKTERKIQIKDESISGDTLRQICTKEEQRLFEARVSKLSEKLRETLSLKYSGLDTKEISEILGIKEGTVRSRIHNALKIISEV